MINKQNLKEILQIKLPQSIPRPDYVQKIFTWMNRKEIIIIKGIRRSGKTNIMYQLMERLPKENTFYVNFDDFRFSNYLNTDLLEKLMELRDQTKRAYYFFDEIQRVPGFEKWLRTYYDQQVDVKFVIGGSNISLLSKDMGTVLTGRNITFTVYPLSYHEFKEFSNQPFSVYLEFGGFPEVVLEEDNQKKRELLEQYFSDIVARDILDKYKIETTLQLKALIKFFLMNPGVRISANKLASQLGIHKDTAQRYISYVLDSFLIFEVPYFSYSAKTKYIASRSSKYYAIDNGFHSVLSMKKNLGKLYENIVAIHLKKNQKEVMYWIGEAEIDFICNRQAIQVTSSDQISEREITSFNYFEKKHRIFEKIVVCPTKKSEGKVKVIPIGEFLSL